MSIKLVELTAGETIKAGPLTIRVLEDGDNTEHRLGLVEITMPPGILGPPQHVHREHDETFYVVAGHPVFTSGTETIDGRPGVLVTLPIGTAHTFANPGESTATMLCTVTPDRYIGYFRELAALPAGPTGLDPAAVGALMSKYATDVVASP